MIQAENLLMATGLLEVPERSHLLAGAELAKGLADDLIAAFDRTDPGRLYVYPERVRYWDRLRVEPDYDDLLAAAEAVVGGEAADAYIAAHQKARAAVMGARPKMVIGTVLGPREMSLDPVSQGTWDLLVDVVEGVRLSKDLAAGALLPMEVQMFQACFPDTYRALRKLEDEQLTKRMAAKKSYEPEPWLATSLLVFEGRPPGAKLSVAEGVSPEPGRPTKEVKISKVAKDLKPASQETGT